GRHAGPGGQVTLSSRAEAGELFVAVDDDGPGIPAAERGRVFDRFHRSEPARGRGSGGGGPGLGTSGPLVAAPARRAAGGGRQPGGARVAFALPGFVPTMRALSANA